MNIVAIIQARVGSTRFPNKIHADLCGQTVLERVVRAAARIKDVDRVTVAYPYLWPQVSEEDVLGRYYWAAREYDAEAIVRITGDCPLLDPQVSSLVVQRFIQSLPYQTSLSYVSNIYPRRTWPDGLDTEVFTRALLERAHREATDPADREHVTPWMQRHTPLYEQASVELRVDWSHVRLTVDTQEDLEWLRQVIQSPKSL